MRRIWNSDLLVSWGGLAVRLVSGVIVLPFALIAFPPEEAALWLFLAVIAGFSTVASFGLYATFTRLLSYALGGASVDQFQDSARLVERRDGAPDREALRRVVTTLCGMGVILTGIAVLLFAIGGGVAATRLIGTLENPETGWFALAITVASGALSVWGQIHVAFLMGGGRVLSLRRWELFTSLGQSVSMLVLILSGGGFLALVAAGAFWNMFNVARNAYLARRHDEHGAFRAATIGLDREVMHAAWPAQWRVGVAVVFTLGVVQASGIVAAQFGTPGETASYLFHLRLITMVNSFALPPLYNRIPELSRYMAGHRFDMLRDLARRRMALAYQSFAAAFIAMGVLGQWFIETFASANYDFSPTLWAAFGAAFFMERVAGMHGQLYMLTNRVMYLLNIASGAIYLGLAVALVSWLGVIAFPLAYLAGLSFAFAPIIMTLTHRFFSLPFPEFEMRTSAIPLTVILIYAAGSLLT